MSYTAQAFLDNKQEICPIGVSSIAPQPVPDVNEIPDIKASNNNSSLNTANGISAIAPVVGINYTNNNDYKNDLVSRANIASPILRDKEQTGMQCASGSDLNYGVQQSMSLMSQTLTSLFSAAKPDNDFEMQAPKPQAFNGFGL